MFISIVLTNYIKQKNSDLKIYLHLIIYVSRF